MPLYLGRCTPSWPLWFIKVSPCDLWQFPCPDMSRFLSKHPLPIVTFLSWCEHTGNVNNLVCFIFWKQSCVFLFLSWIQPSVFVSVINSLWERMQMCQWITLCGVSKAKQPSLEEDHITWPLYPREMETNVKRRQVGGVPRGKKSRFTFSRASVSLIY